MKHLLHSAVAVVGTAVTYLIGQWDVPLLVLVIFMAADYITGVLLAVLNKKLSSSVGFRGLAKKASILLVIVLAVMLDRLLNEGVWLFRTLCAYFYIANEGVSILENAALLGIPVPKKLREVLAQLNTRADSSDETK